MNILVCIKQVPSTNQVEVDPVTGVLKRDGGNAKLNPYDLFALEAAFSIAQTTGGSVKTLSMGPPQARTALLESLWMGADSATLLSDKKLGGADVAATSYALALGVRAIGEFDLILCGKQTTDGDTAQVGPELAEQLHIDHAANVVRIDGTDPLGITVTLDLDDRYLTQRMQFPCLLTIDKGSNTPRLPSFLRRQAIDEAKAIQVLSVSDLPDADEKRLGLTGSPTQVERIFPPEKNAEKATYTGTSEELAETLYNILLNKKLL